MERKYVMAVIALLVGFVLSSCLFFLQQKFSLLPFSLAVLVSFCIIAFDDLKNSNTPESFFFADRKLKSNRFRWTFVTSNVGLFNSIFYTTFVTYYFGPAGIIYPLLAWFLGIYWFSVKAPKLLPFLKKGYSLHQFLSDTYGKNEKEKSLIRRMTSIVSITLLWASLSIEVKFAAELLSYSYPTITGVTIASVIAVIGVIYTYFSGYKGITSTDVFQGALMLMGAVSIIVLSILMLNASDFIVSSDFKTLEGYFLGPYPVGLVSMAVLLLPFQFCMMDMWQRCISIAKNFEGESDEVIAKHFKRDTFLKTILPFLVLFSAWYAMAIAVKWVGLTDDPSLVIHVFLNFVTQQDGFFYFLLSALIAGALIGALLTTFDSYLIAITQGFMYDWWGHIRSHLKPVIVNEQPSEKQQQAFLSASKFWIGLIGFSSIALATVEVKFFDFWVGMYSLMLAFFPAVYIALQDGEKASQSYSCNAVFNSILIGFLVALSGTFLGGFFGMTFYGATYTDVSTIASPICSLLTLVLLGKYTKTKVG